MEDCISYGKIILAVLGGLLGPTDSMLRALIVFMVIDYVTGIMVGGLRKNLNSETGFKGIAKKVYILFLIIVANMLDVYVLGDGSVVRGVVIAFYLANEALSIVENAGKLGVPVPGKLMDALEQLKGDDGNGGAS